MLDFLEGMDQLQKIFWYIALITSLIFLVQTVLTFTGSHSADVANTDFDGDLNHADAPFQLFSLRNLINFLLGFGWTGVAFFETIPNKMILVALAFAVGVAFVFIFFILIVQIMKLTEDNTFNIQNLAGKSGEVYLNIPAEMSGRGKVLISVKGSNHELQAMTRSEISLLSSRLVKVVEILDGVLIVSPV
ncbi:hypothetical protein [Kaistella jeonii]|uniref:Serine protease n=1 Tax=Kaistella jeonii TaxID=266749 RepID=A0A0C1CX89_9FLAO|nr:hypothetical protein [Kaistella jeonii]KIA89001.1 serine protease [Kaistella jeonii]SFB96897.1 hypothetical protein SAMN05421876_104177 [Kaistella jeonii]VEI97202.1 Uncharacterised protein [Kaistella jeonii]